MDPSDPQVWKAELLGQIHVHEAFSRAAKVHYGNDSQEYDIAVKAWGKILALLDTAVGRMKPKPTPSAQAMEAYDKIDRFLRNNLDDAAYAEYVAALELILLG